MKPDKRPTGQQKQDAQHLIKLGRLKESRVLLQSICQKSASDTQAWFLLSMVNGQLGRYQEVIECGEHILRINPDHAGAHTNIGNALATMGKPEEAISHYREALRLQPENPSILNNLGNALHLGGNPEEAADCFRRSVEAFPENALAWYNLANVLRELDRLDGSVTAYKRSIKISPGLFEAHCQLANALRRSGQMAEAIKTYLHALAIQPEHSETRHQLGTAYLDWGKLDESIACLQEALRLDPDSPTILCSLATAHRARGDLDKACSQFSQALDIDPDNLQAHGGLLDVHERMGKHDLVYQGARKLIDAGNENTAIAVVFSEICRKFNCCEQALELLQRVLSRKDLNDGQQSNLNFALGNLYDKSEAYDQAFTHYQQANAKSHYRFNHDTHRAEIGKLVSSFSTDNMATFPRASNESTLPVFIVGMPRSGTTLTEQILATHSQIYGAGELNTMNELVQAMPAMLETQQQYPDCLQAFKTGKLDAFAQHYLQYLKGMAPDAKRITDKMPHNFKHLGLISLLLPKARVIHCVRDPRDTCLSIYFQNFSAAHPYATDLADLGFYYHQYQRLMSHWKAVLDIPILEIHYEDLVNNTEIASRKLIEFCGLEWQTNCLDFHNTDRSVATASYNQVRQPIYRKSVGRWKRYSSYLSPLVEALENTAIQYPFANS